MKNIAFMFGAGAEGKENFDIKNGFNFLKNALFSTSELKESLRAYFHGKKYFENTYKYTSNLPKLSNSILKNLLSQKASNDMDFFIKYRDILISILSKDRLKQICYELETDDVSDLKNKIHNDTSAITEEFDKIISNNTNYAYNEIEQGILKEIFTNDNGTVNYNSNIAVSGLLDEYFHTIINPKKYSTINFSKIFNFYLACYFTILEDILKFLSKNGYSEFNEYLDNDKMVSYQNVLNNIHVLTELLYSEKITKKTFEKTYYTLIKNKLNECAEKLKCCGVITTNYFCFCEAVSDEVAYLNGQLKYFEYPEFLEVDDLNINECKDSSLLFPFIFSQSLVKPIVHSKQIEAFNKLNDILKEASILVILGFNINEDDNHINAFLHDFVQSKQIIIVTDNESFDVCSKLKYCGGNAHICKVRYGDNEEVICKIFNEIQNIMDERKENQK